MQVHLLQVCACTFSASRCEEQKEVQMAQGVAGTNEDKVDSSV